MFRPRLLVHAFALARLQESCVNFRGNYDANTEGKEEMLIEEAEKEMVMISKGRDLPTVCSYENVEVGASYRLYDQSLKKLKAEVEISMLQGDGSKNHIFDDSRKKLCYDFFPDSRREMGSFIGDSREEFLSPNQIKADYSCNKPREAFAGENHQPAAEETEVIVNTILFNEKLHLVAAQEKEVKVKPFQFDEEMIGNICDYTPSDCKNEAKEKSSCQIAAPNLMFPIEENKKCFSIVPWPN